MSDGVVFTREKEPNFTEDELEEIQQRSILRLEAGGGDRAYLTNLLANDVPLLIAQIGLLTAQLKETELRLQTSWSAGHEEGKSTITKAAWDEGYLHGRQRGKKEGKS